MKNSTAFFLGGIFGGSVGAIYSIIRYEKPLEKEIENRDKMLKHSLMNTQSAIEIAKYWEEQYNILKKYVDAFNEHNDEG